MADLLLSLDVVGGVLLAGALLVGAVVLRRLAICRAPGTFECSMRRTGGPSAWSFGIARYTDTAVEWFTVLSLLPRPHTVLARSDMAMGSRRVPTSAEAMLLPPRAVVVSATLAGRPAELALDERALTGLLAWLEASPPGRNVNVA